MSNPAFDFQEARNRMVDCQVRPNKVTDPRILMGMRSIPRERFLPPTLANFAYVDEDVPLGNGRVLMEPVVIARLIQLAAPVAGEAALVVAAGTGYSAALLMACGAKVTALEADEVLLQIARNALPAVAPGVKISSSRLTEGRAEAIPWDIILVNGAVREVPTQYWKQLRVHGGRLVTVLAGKGQTGKAILAERTPSGLSVRPVFDCATPLLPSLLPEASFVF